MLRVLLAFSTSLLLMIAPGNSDAGVTGIQIDGNEVSATIELPGDVQADLTLRFEQAIGLSERGLGMSVESVDPSSESLLGQLPNSDEVAVPAGFPVLLSIEPPTDGGLSFEGVVEIELYTANLQYVLASPLRLFSSSDGERFRDITSEISGGSYRTRGSGGTFSDFLIAVDTRPLAATIDHKFDRLVQVLEDHGADIAEDLAGELDGYFNAAWEHWLNGNISAAIAGIRNFEDAVRAGAADGQMPNIWSSAGDLDNVGGMLRAEARTLRFSLGLAGAGLL